MGFGRPACLPKTIFFVRKTVRLTVVFNVGVGELNIYSYSILPAISLFGMLECMIVEGSYNTDLFLTFIEDLLLKMQPFPGAKSVVIMDNCAIHKDPKIRDLILER